MSVVDVLRAARRLSALSGTDSRRTSGAGADPIWAGGGVGAGRGAGMSTAAPRTRGICREIRCVRRGLRNASLPTGREGVAKGAAMLTCRSDSCARRVRVACSTKPSRMRRPFLPRMSLSNAPRRTPRRSITFCAWLRRANSFRRMAAPGSQVAELLGGNEARPPGHELAHQRQAAAVLDIGLPCGAIAQQRPPEPRISCFGVVTRRVAMTVWIESAGSREEVGSEGRQGSSHCRA